MRIWMISDTHFGIKGNSLEWLEIQKNYFYEFLLPLIRKEYKPGDIFILAGDLFDNRQNINVLVNNTVLEIIEELKQYFDDVYILVGNHDIYRKNSNDINSIKQFNYLDKVHVIEEPTVIRKQETDILLMPWRINHEEEKKCVQEYTADYLFCHTDVQGMSFNKFVKIEKGNSADTYKKFKKVFSGHIHYTQQLKNVHILGSPCELTRSDTDNTKYVSYLDLDDGKITYFKNEYSPKHVKIQFNDVLELTWGEFVKLIKNNFVDLFVDDKILVNNNISSFLDKIHENCRSCDLKILRSDLGETELTQDYGADLNIVNMTEALVENIEADDETKTKVFEYVKQLYFKSLQEV